MAEATVSQEVGFRAWLQWAIEQARYNRDALDPHAAQIMTSVLEQYDAREARAGQSEREKRLAEALRAENAGLRQKLADLSNNINVEGSPFHKAQQALDEIVAHVKREARAALQGAKP